MTKMHCTISHSIDFLPGCRGSSSLFRCSRHQFLMTIIFIMNFLGNFLHILHMCSVTDTGYTLKMLPCKVSDIYAYDISTGFACNHNNYNLNAHFL